MNAVGNLQPKRLADMCEAIWNDLARRPQAARRLLELNKAVFFDTNPIPIKYMAKRLG
jgi:4-hydroxy-tetrahydrodipicolinate synthase